MAFPKLAALLGLASASDAVTNEHLTAAEGKIAQLEQEKTTAEQRAQTAEASLATMTTRATTAEASLATATDKVATLEKWKQEQKAVDGREEDASNDLDEDDKQPLAAWEVATQQAVNRARASVNKNKGRGK